MMEQYLFIFGLTVTAIFSIITWKRSIAIKARNIELESNSIALIFDINTKVNAYNNLTNSLLEKNIRINELKSKYGDIINIEEIIEIRKSDFKSTLKALEELNDKYTVSLDIYNHLEEEIEIYKSDLNAIRFGLYKPQYNYFTAEEYKQKIEHNYIKQRECLVTDMASICDNEWQVSGNKKEGKKITETFKKLMLFAFNGECDALIAKLTWNTATKTIERLNKSFETINKLGAVVSVEITRDYFKLKYDELALNHEFENKRQTEKEEQRRIRDSMREEEKSIRDFEVAQKEAEEDEKRYQKALTWVKEDLRYASKDDIESLNEKIGELEVKLKDALFKKERAISMAQQTKVGHIYVISNIGSFGENIYKIGMTRRLEPLDRVKELSDAALPFKYDVHAIIFSENAPQFERDLHLKFDSQRINRVNGRKEFFNVNLDQIEEYVRSSNDAEIKFTLLAEAREYRETLIIKESLINLLDNSKSSQELKFPKSLLQSDQP